MSFTARASDGVFGGPAAGLRARLERLEGGDWLTVAEADADAEGRVLDWRENPLRSGRYRISFDTDRYFATLGLSVSCPVITVMFKVLGEGTTGEILLIVAPNSYTVFLHAS